MTTDSTAAIFADPDALTMRALVTELTDTFKALSDLVDEASEVMFMPSPVPRPAEDTTERAKGGHSDPTLRIVQDARRLAVRQFVLDSIRLARRTLADGEKSLDRWAGTA